MFISTEEMLTKAGGVFQASHRVIEDTQPQPYLHLITPSMGVDLCVVVACVHINSGCMEIGRLIDGSYGWNLWL